jgi:NAD-dependent deacetylase
LYFSIAGKRMYNSIARLLLDSQRVLFITGAGISADSGLPTYRGLGGLYEEDLTSEGYSIEEALSGAMLARHPEITWKYLQQIGHNCRNAQPNAAHQVIAALEKLLPYVLVYTQNVDGLHAAAGSQKLIEIHGKLHHFRCTRCNFQTTVNDYESLPLPPSCPLCNSIVRPDVVLFGEALPRAAIEHLESSLAEGFDLVFSIGTSSLFPYIVEPVVWAASVGIPCIEINPGETTVSAIVDYAIKDGAAAAMSRVWQTLQDLRSE